MIGERVEATEIAERIHGHHDEGHSAHADETFRKLTAIYVGIAAMLLAIAALGGSHATKTMLNANIQASDTYGFYQARNIRQTSYQLAADELELQLAALPDLPGKQRARSRARSSTTERVVRYESDPATGEGKKELLAKAKALEAKRDLAAEQDPNFEYSEALFQIAIVLGSVSIVAASRPLVMLSGVLAVVGIVVDDQRIFSARASAARVPSSSLAAAVPLPQRIVNRRAAQQVRAPASPRSKRRSSAAAS